MLHDWSQSTIKFRIQINMVRPRLKKIMLNSTEHEISQLNSQLNSTPLSMKFQLLMQNKILTKFNTSFSCFSNS